MCKDGKHRAAPIRDQYDNESWICTRCGMTLQDNDDDDGDEVDDAVKSLPRALDAAARRG